MAKSHPWNNSMRLHLSKKASERPYHSNEEAVQVPEGEPGLRDSELSRNKPKKDFFCSQICWNERRHEEA